MNRLRWLSALQVGFVGLVLVVAGAWHAGSAWADVTWQLYSDSDAANSASATLTTTNSERGVTFTTNSAATVNALRAYRMNSGTQLSDTWTAHLWNAGGTLLVTASCPTASSAGWVTCSFGSPVTLLANATYTASVHFASGSTAPGVSSGAPFNLSHPAACLTTPASGSRTGGFDTFPTTTSGAAMFVDVRADCNIAPPVAHVVCDSGCDAGGGGGLSAADSGALDENRQASVWGLSLLAFAGGFSMVQVIPRMRG